MHQILKQTLVTIHNIKITLSNVLFTAILLPSLFLCFYWFIKFDSFLHSEMFLKLALTLIFYMVSILSGLLTKIFEHKNYVCSNNKNHCDIIIILSRFITWVLLFAGLSYTAYTFENYITSLYLIGYVFDIFVAIILLSSFFTFIKLINSETKE